jgi:hypothetical protein
VAAVVELEGRSANIIFSLFSLEATVWEDMKKIKNDPYLPKELGVIGYIWDSRGNKMTEVGTL